MTRALLSAIAVVGALVSGAAAEGASWAAAHGLEAAIGAEPWAAASGGSAAFGADDAYVFADAAASPRLDDDAIAVAVRIDQTRLAEAAGPAPHTVSNGRVDAAFSRFVAIGPDGLAYASLGLARGEPGATRVARAPEPSLVAMLPPLR